MARKSWNLFTNMVLLSFISYASTELPPKLMFRITWSFSYCSLWYNDMKLCYLLTQGLGSFYFENTKPGKTLMLNFTDTHSRAILTNSKPIASHCIVSLLKLSASKRSLDWFIFLGSFTYTSIKPKSMRRGCKTSLHPPEKKEKHEWHAWLKERERDRRRGRCRVLDTKPPWKYIFISHSHLTHEMSIWTAKRH